MYFAVIYSSNNIDPSDIASVTLEFSDGRKTELTDTDGISLYVNAIMDATEISSPLRAVTDTDGVKILCDRKDKILEYTLYPELSLNGCMISKGDGKYYVLTVTVQKHCFHGRSIHIFMRRASLSRSCSRPAAV